MSKRSSSRNRHKSSKKRSSPGRKPSTHPLKMTVATYPTSDAGGISLARDVDLVKAAVLYADEVELISAGASMLSGMRNLSDAGAVGLAQVLMELDDETLRYVGGDILPDGWRETLLPAMVAISLEPEVLRSLPGGDEITDDTFAELREAAQGMDEVTAQLQATATAMVEASGASEILPAIDAGIVRLVDLGRAGDEMVEEWAEHMRRLLTDNRSRLLFDDKVGSLIRHLIETEGIETTGLPLKHAGEAAVGSGLIARLPVFVDPPIDEIIQLRSDLQVPLRKYRSAAGRLANRLHLAPYETGSADEIDDLFRSEVEPALDELQEGFATHGLIREASRSLGKDVSSLATVGSGAILYMALNSTAVLDSWAAALVGVGAAGAQALASGKMASAQSKRELESRELFYLYEVNRRL